MEDVVKNATTESIKLISGQEITGELTMKLKTLLHSCNVDNINIALIDCKSDYAETRINIRNRKDFCDFIDTYGNSIVNEWMVCNGRGTPWIRFYLQNLVKEVKPTTKLKLARIIEDTIEQEGLNCDLNFIDTSLITDMSWLFSSSKFNGNISNWDVSNVTNMYYMFWDSKFNGDISKWDVKNVRDMKGMFGNSQFNRDISNWDVSNVKDMNHMFCLSPFNGDISNWDVSNVKDMNHMFKKSLFNGDISKWNVSNVRTLYYMFTNCPLEKNPPEWY